MRFGKIVRPSGFNATLDSVDTSAAEKMPGVKVVHDGDFIGVVAPSAWDAEQAMLAIKAKWNVPPQPSNANIFEYLKTNLESGGGGARQSSRSSTRKARVESGLRRLHPLARSTWHSPTPCSTSRTRRWSREQPWRNGTQPAN